MHMKIPVVESFSKKVSDLGNFIKKETPANFMKLPSRT